MRGPSEFSARWVHFGCPLFLGYETDTSFVFRFRATMGTNSLDNLEPKIKK